MELLMNGKSITSLRQYCKEIVGALTAKGREIR